SSLYAQDDWRLNEHLTVNYGVRWDVNPSPAARDGHWLATFDDVNDIDHLRLAPKGTRLYETRYNSVAPRLGVAYRLCRQCNLVLRSGWGRFFDLGGGGVLTAVVFYPN